MRRIESYRLPATGEEAVLHTLVYADIFDYPLARDEIKRYLIGQQATDEEIDSYLQNGFVGRTEDFFSLPGREGLLHARLERKKHNAALWRSALRYGRWMAKLPYVRMVAVTGALAANNADVGADIDFFIVTKPGRLWLSRALILAFARVIKIFGVTLCPNYLVTENNLEFEERDLFSAQELCRMVPLAGLERYLEVREKNAWTHRYLPNAASAPDMIKVKATASNSILQKLSEMILDTPLGDQLERWERERKIARFRAKSDENGETSFTADCCKGHFDGHGSRTMAAFLARLEAYSKK